LLGVSHHLAYRVARILGITYNCNHTEFTYTTPDFCRDCWAISVFFTWMIKTAVPLNKELVIMSVLFKRWRQIKSYCLETNKCMVSSQWGWRGCFIPSMYKNDSTWRQSDNIFQHFTLLMKTLKKRLLCPYIRVAHPQKFYSALPWVNAINIPTYWGMYICQFYISSSRFEHFYNLECSTYILNNSPFTLSSQTEYGSCLKWYE